MISLQTAKTGVGPIFGDSLIIFGDIKETKKDQIIRKFEVFSELDSTSFLFSFVHPSTLDQNLHSAFNYLFCNKLFWVLTTIREESGEELMPTLTQYRFFF